MITEPDDRAGPATSDGLTDEEAEAVIERKAGSPKVIHEVIRLQGEDELGRPWLSLTLSGFAAGLAITASVMAQAFLRLHLPDTPARELIAGLGYTIGFVIVVLGNLQLFTESTVTAVLPVATHPSLRNFGRLLRLWGVVFAANLAGTLLVATLMAHTAIISAEQLDAALAVSAKLLDHAPGATLLLGIPAGFLVGSIAWILPNARSSDFFIIASITYVVVIGGFSHVVAGSTEAWLLWLTGRASLGWAVGGFILPALAGNIIGGTGLFAVLAHGQVRGEIETR